MMVNGIPARLPRKQRMVVDLRLRQELLHA